ncbi:MAG: hypothetical protein ABID45_03420 [Patescibacteria group bacterium]
MTFTTLLLNLLPYAILALIIVWAIWSYDTVNEGELKVLCRFGNPVAVRQPGFAWRVFPIIYSYMTFKERWVVPGDETKTRFNMAEVKIDYTTKKIRKDPFEEAGAVEFGGKARPAFLDENLRIKKGQPAMANFGFSLVKFFRSWKRTSPMDMLHQELDSLGQVIFARVDTIQELVQQANNTGGPLVLEPAGTTPHPIRTAIGEILNRCLIYNGTIERIDIDDRIRGPLEKIELSRIDNEAATEEAEAIEKRKGAEVAAIVNNLPDGVTPDQVADTIKKTLGKGDWTEIVLDPRVIAAMGDAMPEILARFMAKTPKKGG